MPAVTRLPWGPTVKCAPRLSACDAQAGTPNDSDPPDLLRFRVTPGAMRILRQKRKLIRFLLLYKRLQQCIRHVRIELDVDFGGHIIRKVDQLTAAGNGNQ